MEVFAKVEGGLKLDMPSHLLAKDCKLEALQVDYKHIWGLLDE